MSTVFNIHEHSSYTGNALDLSFKLRNSPNTLAVRTAFDHSARHLPDSPRKPFGELVWSPMDSAHTQPILLQTNRPRKERTKRLNN